MTPANTKQHLTNLLCTTLLMLMPLLAPAAQQDIDFGHVGIRDGLSNSRVNVIFKDSRGYLWIGTQSGLNRFDGHRFKTYYYKSTDKNSLPNNWISEIQEAAGRRLLIKTPMGYTIFDTDTETFDSDNSAWMMHRGLKGTMDRVLVDRRKNWVVASHGIGVYFAKRHGGTTLMAFGKDLPRGTVTAITEHGTTYILTYGDGRLVAIDAKRKRLLWVSDYITRHRQRDSEDHYRTYVSRFCNYWVTANGQTWIYNQQLRRWFSSVHEYLAEQHYSDIPDGEIHAKYIVEDHAGRLWMGTEHRGLVRINYADHSVRQYEYSPDNQLSLADNTVQSLYLDPSGDLWVGTYKNGLSYYSPNAARFVTVPLGDVCTITEDTEGRYWCGTNDSGIVVYDPHTGEQRHYRRDETGLGSDVIVSSMRLSDGSLWFGTFNGGLACFAQGRWTVYRDAGSALNNDNVWSLCEAPDGRVAIGTLGGGVQLLNPITRRFDTYDLKTSHLASDYISSLDATRGGQLLVAHSRNFSLIDPDTRKVTNYDADEHHPALPSPDLNHAIEDSRGLIWAATSSGCAVIDPRTRQVTQIDWMTATTGSVACALAEDKSGNIWLASDHGVSRIQVRKGSEGWEFFSESFNEYDGLQKRQLNFRSILCASNGDIIVGGQDGINIIKPQQLVYRQSHERVLFAGLRLFDHDIAVGEKADGRVLLEHSMDDCRHIDLHHDENAFTILLATDNVTIPATSRYYYRLSGLSDRWQMTAQGEPFITLTNLSPGRYTLEVRAVLRNGTASDAVSTLELHINPPFYRSWWAYILYILLALGTAWTVRRLVLRRQLERYRIERERQEAERNRQMDELKLTFFTNVSHELRTPLTLIVSPLAKMIAAETNPEKRDRLALVHRNATRLFELVNQLLDFRKMDSKKQALEPVTGDIIVFVTGIANSFQLLDGRGIEFVVHTELEHLSMTFDADKVRKIVANLLSNAFKYTPQDGRVSLSMTVHPKALHGEDALYIMVADTGDGVPDDDKAHIFEPFYQASNHTSNPYGGSGVGLSLVSEFAAMHDGTVSVADNPGGGSLFTVALPVRHDASLQTLPMPDTLAPVAPEATAEDESAKTHKPKGRRAEVLLVDDAEDFLTFMAEVLAERYKVRTARDGEEALRMIEERQPDIILSDVMMPHMDGRELCRRLKTDAATQRIPFIMLTARVADTQVVEGMQIGADDYLTKPFNMDILFLRIDNLLKWRQAAAEPKPVIEADIQQIEVTSVDKEFVQQVTAYIEDNLSDDDISVERLAEANGVSRVQLYRRLLSLTGSTPSEFIRSIRLRHAAALLADSQLTVSEVAYRVGFSSPRSFSRSFSEAYGMTPSQYVKEKSADQG